MELRNELENALMKGEFAKYLGRAKKESKSFLYGESCGWDREKMIAYALHGPNGDEDRSWLGREVFETAFDDGSMREMSEIYHNALVVYEGKHKSAA